MAGPKRSTKLSILVAGVVVLAVLVACWFLFRGPPQMGPDKEVFAAVDALFTAVTARDENLLGKCEQRLHALKDAGRLPREASDYLDGVVAQARAGGWQSAAEKLYWFMKGQRREGAPGHPPRKETGPIDTHPFVAEGR